MSDAHNSVPAFRGSRRSFLRRTNLAAMGALVGAAVPLRRWMSRVTAAELAHVEGKDGLTVLTPRPLNAETPPHLLDDEVTTTARHFIRNNGIVPADLDPEKWELRIDGLVDRPMTLRIDDLRSRFEVVTHRLVIECGGNGRSGFEPPTRGNQWTYGAVGCAEWTGVRLADVLEAAGVKSEAIYTAHEGADRHLSGAPDKLPISRGVPIEKAMDPYNLIAFAMNGGPLHPMNGAPLRLVVPGWPGSCSQKWLTRIWLRDVVHDGAKMTGASYRVPRYPVAPGVSVPEQDLKIIHAMPVKSLITRPRTGERSSGLEVEVAGHAWVGDSEVAKVDVSIDFGATWQPTRLSSPHNRHAWQRFVAQVAFPQSGYFEVWARATDASGASQPFRAPWNPKGYLNNAMHHVSVHVG